MPKLLKLSIHRLDIWMSCLTELQLHTANSFDTEALFLNLHLTISDGLVSSKIYDKYDDFYFVNFPFLDGDIPRATSYGVHGVYISQLIRFARVSSQKTCS